MKRKWSKGLILVSLLVLAAFSWAQAEDLTTVKLPDPNKQGGMSVMDALAKRASVRSWADKEIASQDLSDLLWAANGINRPDSKKRTAPSAGNAQDVDIYVFTKDGAYLYDYANHALTLLASGDHRSEVTKSMSGPPPGAQAAGSSGSPPAGQAGAPGQAASSQTEKPASAPAGGQPAAAASEKVSSAPINLVLVTDLSKFPFGTDDLKIQWAAIDVGIVSQNIAIVCSAKGLGTRPIAGVNEETLKTLLKLKDTQKILLEHPVGYLQESK